MFTATTNHEATLGDLDVDQHFHNLWFQVLDLLQKLVVLLHQLIVAFCLGLFELQTQKEANTRVASKHHPAHTHTQGHTLPYSLSSTHPFYVLDNFIDI